MGRTWQRNGVGLRLLKVQWEEGMGQGHSSPPARTREPDGNGSGVHRAFGAGDTELIVVGVAQMWPVPEMTPPSERAPWGASSQDRVLPVGGAEGRAPGLPVIPLEGKVAIRAALGTRSARFKAAKEGDEAPLRAGKGDVLPGGQPGQVNPKGEDAGGLGKRVQVGDS